MNDYFLIYDVVNGKQTLTATTVTKDEPLKWLAKEALKNLDLIYVPKFWAQISSEAAVLYATYMETLSDKIKKEQEAAKKNQEDVSKVDSTPNS